MGEDAGGVATDAPALLINTVTSPAASTAASIDAGSVMSRVSGTIRSSSQVRGGACGGVDLAGAAGEGAVDKVGADAAVCASNEDDCSME